MVGKIAGQMLEANLLRDGEKLAFETDLFVLDVVGNKVGIGTLTPTADFDVVGNSKFNGLIATTSLVADSIVTVDANGTLVDHAGLKFDGNSLKVDNISPVTAGVVTVDGTAGFKIPGGDTAQRPLTPESYTIRYNTDLGVPEIYNGVSWETMGPAQFAGLTSQIIDGNGLDNVFTLNQETSSESIIVHINGVMQAPEFSYAVDGNQITFVEIPHTTDRIEVRFLSEMAHVNAISNASGASKVQAFNDRVSMIAGSEELLTVGDDNAVSVSNSHGMVLPVFTVAEVANIANPQVSQMVYVSDGDSGNPCIGVYDGIKWSRMTFGLEISST